MNTTTVEQPVVAPPCPSWCGLPAGHPYDDEDLPGQPVRTHRLVVAESPAGRGHYVDIGVVAQLLEDGTEQLIDLPAVEAQIDGDLVLTNRDADRRGLSPAELRELAGFLVRALNMAADRLEAIEVEPLAVGPDPR